MRLRGKLQDGKIIQTESLDQSGHSGISKASEQQKDFYAHVYENNPASMKVLEKAGFHKCGIFRKACFKNGKFVDCHCYELVSLK